MTRQILDIGSDANDGTGDTLRAAMDKVNENFSELYSCFCGEPALTFSGNNIHCRLVATTTSIFMPVGHGHL
jgi:hypothetical protein